MSRTVFVIVWIFLAASSARADGGKPAMPFRADIEIDPTAYVFGGHSLHAGVAKSNWRVDLGAFGMDLPEALHGVSALRVSFQGYGAKLQYFFDEMQTGGFVGVGLGVNNINVALRKSTQASQKTQLGTGLHGGWRFNLPAGFYVTPWLGIDYAFGAREITLAGNTYKNDPLSFFPAVHFGYRFE